jgi:hypothetical protein
MFPFEPGVWSSGKRRASGRSYVSMPVDEAATFGYPRERSF